MPTDNTTTVTISTDGPYYIPPPPTAVPRLADTVCPQLRAGALLCVHQYEPAGCPFGHVETFEGVVQYLRNVLHHRRVGDDPRQLVGACAGVANFIPPG